MAIRAIVVRRAQRLVSGNLASALIVLLGTNGELKWTGEWISFLDTMLQLSVLRLPGRGLRLPTRVRSLRIDPSIHLERAKEGTCEVKVDPKMDMVVAGGVELKGKPRTQRLSSRFSFHVLLVGIKLRKESER